LRKCAAGRGYSRVVYVTKAGTTRVCAICERTLLMGERAIRYAPEDGAELVDVCPLCQETALEHGWIKEGTPTVPTVPGPRKRRRRGFGEFLGISRASTEDSIAPPEPILRRLSVDEVALLEAADLFNASSYRRTVGGIAKSLGDARASIIALSGVAGEMAVTIAWDISWYQYRVTPDSGQPVRLERRGHELDELEVSFKDWNAHIDDDGRLIPEIARL
jgi:hypothetical protein